MDTGVSVRKRVIKIIRDLYISKCDFAKRTDALVRILTRINDEETSIQVRADFYLYIYVCLCTREF
jgi:cohesin loading factor subunit SCC2